MTDQLPEFTANAAYRWRMRPKNSAICRLGMHWRPQIMAIFPLLRMLLLPLAVRTLIRNSDFCIYEPARPVAPTALCVVRFCSPLGNQTWTYLRSRGAKVEAGQQALLGVHTLDTFLPKDFSIELQSFPGVCHALGLYSLRLDSRLMGYF
ncbi:hypothetical protein VTK26DRAFT_5396 [Humicola hyalothermophila]